MMNDNRLRLLVIAVAIFFIIVALCFGSLLNIASFKKNYLESLSGSYQVAAMSTKRIIEYSIRYGKPLDKFTGMGELLAELKDSLENLENVSVVSPNGRVLYDTGGPVKDQHLSLGLQRVARFGGEVEASAYAVGFFEGKYHMFIPIRDKKDLWIGTLDLSIPEAVISNQVDARVWLLAQTTVVIAIVSLNFMVFVLFAISIVDSRGQLRKQRVVGVVAAIFALAQLAFCGINIEMFQKAYVEMGKNTMMVLSHSVKDDVNSVVSRGVSYNRLVGLDQYLEQIISSSPEIDRIAITDSTGAMMYRAPVGRPGSGPQQDESTQYRYFQVLKNDKSGVGGTIHVWLSLEYIHGKIKGLVLDSVAVASLFFLFLSELILILPLLRKYFSADAEPDLDQVPEVTSWHWLRPGAFLFYFATSLELSLCSAQISSVPELRLGLNFGPVLPLLAVGIGAGGGALWTTRGNHLCQRMYIGGLGVALTGMALALLASVPELFIAALALAGWGCGMAGSIWRRLLPAKADKTTTGFLHIGMLMGGLAGCVAGALLAPRIGTMAIYTLGVAISLLTLPGIIKTTLVSQPPSAGTVCVCLQGSVLAAAPLALVWGMLTERGDGIGWMVFVGVVFAAGVWRLIYRPQGRDQRSQ